MEGFLVRRIERDDHYDAYLCQFNHGGEQFAVSQPHEKGDMVLLTATIELPESALERVRQMPHQDFQKQLYYMLKSLLSSGCNYSLANTQSEFRSISVFQPIYYDGLTKDRLINSCYKLRRAFRRIVLILEHAFQIRLPADIYR
ncbi:MAG: DUF2299 family protein [Thaumarchaeota archaeon]|nr:DUF2299 family protein [Nitrososphaerota archaeon]